MIRGDLDHIEGVVYAKDVLNILHQGRGNAPLAELLRPAQFVPESKRAAELLREMRQQKFHIALVTDEFGSVSGLVTLEDMLEELVGEISDEYDLEKPPLVPVADRVFRVSGALPVHELGELLDIELPSGDWDTVGGLMLGLLGAIPREGQEVRCNGLVITAEKMQRRRVVSVLITAGATPPEEHGSAR